MEDIYSTTQCPLLNALPLSYKTSEDVAERYKSFTQPEVGYFTSTNICYIFYIYILFTSTFICDTFWCDLHFYSTDSLPRLKSQNGYAPC